MVSFGYPLVACYSKISGYLLIFDNIYFDYKIIARVTTTNLL